MTIRRHAHQWVRSFAFPGWVCAVDRCPFTRPLVADRCGHCARGRCDLCSTCRCCLTTHKAKPRPVASAEAS